MIPSLKIIVVGDVTVRKTELLFTYTGGSCPEYVPTVFDNYSAPRLIDGRTVNVGLWDTAGQEDSDRLRPLAYPQTDAVIMCFSVVDISSFVNVSLKWVPEIRHHIPNAIILLVGLCPELRSDPGILEKLRKNNQKPLTFEHGTRLAKNIHAIQYLECDVHVQSAVNRVFEEAIRACLKELDPPKKENRKSRIKKKEEPVELPAMSAAEVERKEPAKRRETLSESLPPVEKKEPVIVKPEIKPLLIAIVLQDFAGSDRQLEVHVNDTVAVFEYQGTWCYCQKGQEMGYVPRAYLAKDKEGYNAYVVSDYSKYEKSSLIQLAVKRGTQVKAWETLSADWTFAQLEDKKGCIPKTYISLTPPPEKVEPTIKEEKTVVVNTNKNEDELLQQIERLTLELLQAKKQIHEQEAEILSLKLTESIDLDNLTINYSEMLGKGSFGIVYRGTYFKSQVAVKVVKDMKFTEDAWDDYLNEVNILMYTLLKNKIYIERSLRHPNIVNCLTCSYDRKIPMIVMEYLPLGSLYNWIHQKDRKFIEPAVVLRLLRDISFGMHYLHTKKPMIIHRDLKSPNILLDANLNPKISDFGLSKTKENSHVTNTQVNTRGTASWAAPEYLTVTRRNERSEKGDVFSFGVIVWELVTLQSPWQREFQHVEEVREAILKGQRLSVPIDCPQHLRDVMKMCWKNDPKDRPTFGVLADLFEEVYSSAIDDMDPELERIRNELKIRKKQFGIETE